MTISEIKKYMKIHHITYEKLAEMSDMSIATLKSVFSGRTKDPRGSTLRAIEKALGLAESQWTGDDEANGIFSTLKINVNSEEKYLLDIFQQLKKEEQNIIITLIETMLKEKLKTKNTPKKY